MDNVVEGLRSNTTPQSNSERAPQYLPDVDRQAETKPSHPSFLSAIDADYSHLPRVFEVESGFLDGISLIRVETEIEKTEVGGVLTRDREGRTALKMAGKKGETFELSMAEITDKNFRWYTEGMIKTRDDEGNNNLDIAFVDKDIANANAEYFKGLVDNGMEVVLDKTPIGVVHSHPSGNLPSTGDFAQTVNHASLASSVRPAEVVVTADYVYFLLPTKQTPDLIDEVYTQDGRWKWAKDEETTVRHLADAARGNGVQNPNPESYRNAFRYKFLQEQCAKNNVGFYALKTGDTTAQRIF